MNPCVEVYDCDLALEPEWTARALKVLSSEEVARASRFYFEKDRAEFIHCKGLQRILIGRELGVAADSLTFSSNPFGKPFLEGHPVHFNISHSHGKGLIGLSRQGEIGVDVECIDRKVEPLELAERFFSKTECVELLSLPREQQKNGFFNAWSRKEAYIKARGKGISYGLDNFSVQLTPGMPARLLEDRSDAEATLRWKVENVAVREGFAGAVCCAVSLEVQLRRLSVEEMDSLLPG